MIFAHDLITSYAAYRLARHFKAKIIYDVHDLYIETLNQLFPKDVSFFRKNMFRAAHVTMRFSGGLWERFFIKNTDLVLTVNKFLKSYLEGEYETKNCIVTPNYPVLSKVEKSGQIWESLDTNKDKKIILYHGTLNEGRNLELIVRCAEYLGEDKILVVIGEGNLREKLEKIAESGGFAAKVKFLDFVKYENLLSFIADVSLGLMLLEHINLSKTNASPNKVTEYMAAGVPVLVSDSPELRKMIEKANCGFVKDFENPAQLALFIEKKFAEKKLNELGENGRRAFTEIYNWDKYEHVFLTEFKKLLR